jgi:hypothetical protein
MRGLSSILGNNPAAASMATINQPEVVAPNSLSGLASLGSYGLSGRRSSPTGTNIGTTLPTAAEAAAAATANPFTQATTQVTTPPVQVEANNLVTQPAQVTTQATTPALAASVPTAAQLASIVPAKIQGRDIGLGVVTPAESGYFVYRDPSTGVVMKTRDKAAADYAVTQAQNALTTAGTTDASGNTILANDPGIGDWTQLAKLPADIDYSAFTYNDINDYMISDGVGMTGQVQRPGSYSNFLASQYGSGSNLINGSNFGNMTGIGQQQPVINPYANYNAFSYSDPTTQSAVDALDKALNSRLYTNNFGGSKSLNRNKIDSDMLPFLSGKDKVSIGDSGISMLDAINDADKEKVLQQISAKTGMSVEQLTDAYQNYHYANQSFYKPTATNYADLMSTAAAEDIRTGAEKYSGIGKKVVFDADKPVQNLTEGAVQKVGDKFYFIDPATGTQRYTKDQGRAESLASGAVTGTTMAEIMDSQLKSKPVAKEYNGEADLGLTTAEPIKEVTDSSGNTYYAVLDKDTGKAMIALDEDTANKLVEGESGLRYNAKTGTYLGANEEALDAAFLGLNKPSERGSFTNINKAMSWTDFLPTGVTISEATPEQRENAKGALKAQQNLMQTYINPETLVSNAGTTVKAGNLNLTKDSAPVKSGGNYVFMNDTTGELVGVKNQGLANWAADTTKNAEPFFFDGKYYFFDKDTGALQNTTNPVIARNESTTSNYLGAKNWQDFLPSNVKEGAATKEQIESAKLMFDNQQELITGTTGEGSVFNLFKSENLPLPENFYYDPNQLTRNFNTLAGAGINPEISGSELAPKNVYKESIEYDAPSGGLGGFIKSVLPTVVSMAFPQFAPIIQGLSAVNSLAQGDVFGGLMSMAGASGVLDTVFQGATGGITDSLSNALQSTFNLSPAAASALTRSAMFGSASAINAALMDQDILNALATGAGAGLVAGKINATLASSVANPYLRNYIVGQLTNATISALKDKPIVIAGQVIN